MDFRMHPIKREIEIEGFHSIYYFEFGKNFSHPPQKLDFWVMTYVDSGKINAISDGIGSIVNQGQLIFNKPQELHAHISNRIDHNNMLIISFTSHSSAMEFFAKKIFTLGKTEKTLISLITNAAKYALGKIPDDYNDKNALDFSSAPPGSVQLLECYLTELLLLLLQGGEASYTTKKQSSSSHELVQSSITELIVQYLEENVYSKISLSDLSTKFYMGKSKLCKLFEINVGKGPMQYFGDLKIKEAKKLLRSDDIQISKISDMLGYSTIHNFSRAFKTATGFSPSEYRKKSVH